MDHAYWGPQFGRDEIAGLLSNQADSISQAGCTIEKISDEGELCRRTAAAIADGKSAGSRAAWNGGRGRLATARSSAIPDVKAILNAKIKRRESFRPFAPSVLEEAVSEWFEEDDARS